MEADDEVVLSPRHGDVQQPEPLGRLVAPFVVAEVVVAGGRDERPRGPGPDPQLGAGRAEQDRRRLVGRQGAEAGEDHDGELEALRAVHGEEPQRGIVGLGGDGLLDPDALLGLSSGPLDEAAQAGPARLLPRPGLVEEEPDATPVVPGSVPGRRELQQVPLPHDRVDGGGHAPPPSRLPEAAELAERRPDRAVGLAVPSVVPASARAVVRHQLDVAAPERGGAERGDDRELVGRVVDRGEDLEHVPDLGGGEDEALALDADRDARVLQGALERGEHGPRRDEERDVVGGGRPNRAVRVVHRPALADDLLHGGRHVVRFRRSDGDHGLVGDATDRDHPMLLGRPVAVREERDVGGLHARVLGQQRFEGGVDDVQDGRHRAEVLDQLDGQQPEPTAGVVVDAEIRVPEPVDGLLRVAHEHQRAVPDRDVGPVEPARVGAVGGEEHRQLELQRVGVLELVDQQVPVPVDGGRPRVRMVSQQVPGQDEQVVEEQPSLAAAV